MPCDPFLMKKLLKSGICGFVNSAQMHCSLWISQQVRLNQKKKSTPQKCRRNNQLNPNTHIISLMKEGNIINM